MRTNKATPKSTSGANKSAPAVVAADFGQRLREVRTAKGRTLRDVALNAKVSIAYLSDLERGKLSNPTLDKLRQIANELGVSVDDLLGTEEEAAPKARPSDALLALKRSTPFREAVATQAARLDRPENELVEEWMEILAGIRIGARQPQSVADYLFIFDAASRAIAWDSPPS